MITQQQIDSFRQNGYLLIPEAIPPELLQRLRSLFDQFMVTDTPREGFHYHYNRERAYLSNVDKLCRRGDLCCLDLLGLPLAAEVTTALCGADAVPIQDFAVIKHKGDENPVLWHRDMQYEGDACCINLGFYIDDAAENEGALQVIPGSHARPDSICTLQQEPATTVSVSAGGLLVHDMRLAHASGLLNNNALRRVIYFEMMPENLILQEELYEPKIIELKKSLSRLAQQHYEATGSVSESVTKQQLDKIYALPTKGHPSIYCVENTKTQMPANYTI
jgi:ectoine hydroxylase-related dioxygenase (phytanoyl-CoA dioxygenase family)